MSLSSDVIVIGAGVLGLASAAELSARGLSVIVIDAGGPNASSVAAGMIAPAMESALDDPPAETVELLKTARALWPAFADVSAGWAVAHDTDTREACLAHIERHWTDMRPASLVRAMEGNG